jgi:xanthine/uracil/vitamin C permease (AzgA family)
MVAEKAPTGIRSSIVAVCGLFIVICSLVGMGITVGLMLSLQLSTVCLITAIPTVLVSIGFMAAKVRETKGVKLDEVGQEEASNEAH